MRKDDVLVGGVYLANVSGKLCRVKVLSKTLIRGLRRDRVGWYAMNLETGRTILIRSAQRLRPLPEVKT